MTSLLVTKTPPKDGLEPGTVRIILPPTPPPSGGKQQHATTLLNVETSTPRKKIVANSSGTPVAVNVGVVSRPQPIAPSPFMANTIRVICEPPSSASIKPVSLNINTSRSTFYATAAGSGTVPGINNNINQTQLVAIASKPTVTQRLPSVISPPVPVLIVSTQDSIPSASTKPSSSTPSSTGTNVTSPSCSQSSNPEESQKSGKNKNRVGRPKKSDVEQLQAEGEVSTSEMKCLVCKRVFPRIKSLEAHMRIHTGIYTLVCRWNFFVK